jgi:hypothetical protein
LNNYFPFLCKKKEKKEEGKVTVFYCCSWSIVLHISLLSFTSLSFFFLEFVGVGAWNGKDGLWGRCCLKGKRWAPGKMLKTRFFIWFSFVNWDWVWIFLSLVFIFFIFWCYFCLNFRIKGEKNGILWGIQFSLNHSSHSVMQKDFFFHWFGLCLLKIKA